MAPRAGPRNCGLDLPRAQIDAGALGFEYRKSAPETIKQGIIGFTAVIEDVLEAHA